jgi:predicted amidohydrolase YtcJ
LASLILTNATIYTLDNNSPVVSSLWIQDGWIRGAGTLEQVKALAPKNSKQFDLQNSYILPGLIDAHIHLDLYAQSLLKIDCEVPSLVECLARITDKGATTATGKWILGHGWNQNDWGGSFPHKNDLDRITNIHPIFLTAKSLHAAWANSAALNIAGIHTGTPDPPGGMIQRDQKGEPTGILFESAMQLVADKIPPSTPDETAKTIQSAQFQLWKFGLTGVHDFDRRDCFVALQQLERDKKLKLRVIKSIPLELLQQAIELGLRTGFGNEWLRIGSIKAFADGALGPRTAAMLRPYENEPENSGILLLDQEEIFEIGRKAVSNGLSLAIHAIGDRANHEVLNAYAQLRNFEQLEKLPYFSHRIEHVQLIHPDDIPRLSQLGIIASMQPIHAISDMESATRYWGKRIRFSYGWKSQLDANTQLIFGSDAPVDSPNPFWGIHAALTRAKSGFASSWVPEERISLDAAIRAYTTGPAKVAGYQFLQGKLIPGYYADLIVLNEDPYSTDTDGLRDLMPVKTMVGGDWVYEN